MTLVSCTASKPAMECLLVLVSESCWGSLSDHITVAVSSSKKGRGESWFTDRWVHGTQTVSSWHGLRVYLECTKNLEDYSGSHRLGASWLISWSTFQNSLVHFYLSDNLDTVVCAVDSAQKYVSWSNRSVMTLDKSYIAKSNKFSMRVILWQLHL